MHRLPYIDEHSLQVSESKNLVWKNLISALKKSMGLPPVLIRMLDCDPAVGTPEFWGRIGDSIPGFKVVEEVPEQQIVLSGRHRFAQYELTFLLADGQIRAQSRAEFFGVSGKLYRAVVIGSGAHKVVTRRLLRRIANNNG